MKAAKNFVFGGTKDDNDRRNFKVGDEIPAAIAKELDDSFFLEKLPKSQLTREQLLIMAGVDKDEVDKLEDELTEEGLRQGMSEIGTKEQLASWAKEFFNIEVDTSQTRSDMEDTIVASQFEEAEDDDEEDEDDEE